MAQTIVGPVSAGNEYVEIGLPPKTSSVQCSVLDVDEYWNVESIHISDSHSENNDEITKEQCLKSVERGPYGIYSVSLRWKEESPDLHSNFNFSWERLIECLSVSNVAPSYWKNVTTYQNN